jgi:hypothetical protein
VTSNARLVRFNITTNWGSAEEFIGLSEITFDGQEVPEPASCIAWGLLGLVGACIYIARRTW